MIKETEPVIKGYKYFSENELKILNPLLQLKICFANELPNEVFNGSDIHYFYITCSGYLHCAIVGQ